MRISIFLSRSYWFGVETITTFIRSRSSLENHTRFQKKNGQSVYPFFRPKRPQNHTLWGGTYLYGLYKGVPARVTFAWLLAVFYTLFTWSGGPRSSGVSFFCFVSTRAWKQKEPYPTRPGSPTPCKQALKHSANTTLKTLYMSVVVRLCVFNFA